MLRKVLRFLFPFPAPVGGRLEWVDYAKGICIIFVVMMHSTLGLEAALGREGFMHHVVAFAKPFRMPDFFLISGLFLARVIDRDWRTFLDRKVVHFAYFYVLWVTIQFAFKAPGMLNEMTPAQVAGQYLLAYIEPFGTLWFIYLLPIFFVVTRLYRNFPPLVIFAVAALLQIANIHTGWTVIDEFAARFVYFYAGYILATQIFTFAGTVQARPLLAILGLSVWGFANYAFVAAGWSELPFVSLALGFAGAAAIVAVSALLARLNFFNPLRFVGQNSLVIYLAFFLPMALSRTLIVKNQIIVDPGWASVQVTIQAIVYPLIMLWLARKLRLTFFFERPKMFRLKPKAEVAAQPEAKLA
jgi:uncharacterized membrane protein YcfT